MEETTIVAGDIVKLKSGGPDMTVDYLTGQDSAFASCIYFPDVNSPLQRVVLPILTLVKTTSAT